MNKNIRTCLLLFFSLLCLTSFSQTAKNEYFSMVQKADSLMTEKKYEMAAKLFEEAFTLNNDKGRVGDRYKCAACWTQIKNKDKAFYQLNRLAKDGKFSNDILIEEDPFFYPLQEDKRWKPLMEIIIKNKETKNNKN